MKLRFLPSLLIFVSSYFPLGLILLIKDLNENTALPEHPVVALIIGMIFFTAVATVIAVTYKIDTGIPVTVSKVSNKSGEMFTYTIPYMISFYNFNLGDWKTLACLFVFMGIMFSISYRTRNILVNPVLALVGFGLYDCSFRDGGREKQGMLLSKSPPKVGCVYVIERLSDFIYFVTASRTEGGSDVHQDR